MSRVEQGLSLLIQQYKDSPKLKTLIKSLLTPADGIQEAADQLLTERTLDTAQGVNLDVIGKIIGLPRPFQDPDPELVFTFDNPGEIGQGFTGLGRPDIGGFFVGLDPFDNALVSDVVYRRMLRARIIRNTTNASINDIQRYIEFVFDTAVTITHTVGVVNVNVGRPLSVREVQLLEETFPVAAGVRLNLKTFSIEPNPFGFIGNPQNTGFGEVGVIFGVRVALWLDAMDTGTVIQSGGTVSQWRDKSGAGRHASEGTNRPALIENAINGRSAVRFDGEDDILSATIPEYGDLTVFIVAAQRREELQTDNIETIIATTSSTDNVGFSVSGNAATILAPGGYGDFTAQLYKDGVVGQPGNDPGEVGDLALDEPFIGTAEFTGGTGLTDLRIGALADNSNFGKYDIGEIIIVPRILGQSERNLLEGYLSVKWGIEASAPQPDVSGVGVQTGGGFVGLI